MSWRHWSGGPSNSLQEGLGPFHSEASLQLSPAVRCLTEVYRGGVVFTLSPRATIPANFVARVRAGAVVANAAPACCLEARQPLSEHVKVSHYALVNVKRGEGNHFAFLAGQDAPIHLGRLQRLRPGSGSLVISSRVLRGPCRCAS